MYSAKILADSLNTYNGSRLTTFEITYPRFVHSEFLTHRMISRNSASSRAIPVDKMIQRVQDDPVYPVWWGKAQKGMQATVELDRDEQRNAMDAWIDARNAALKYANILRALDVHKQITNRLLEPWMWITVIASATDWNHFFNLRAHPDAQPEIQKIAYMMLDLYTSNKPIEKPPGVWHLPLIFPEDYIYSGSIQLVSAGRCARISYLTHDGKRDWSADEELATKLGKNSPPHASPLEHPAIALEVDDYIGNFHGWKQLRKFTQDEYTNDRLLTNASSS